MFTRHMLLKFLPLRASLLAAVMLGLVGCSDVVTQVYPDLSVIERVKDKILTTQEQEEALRGLTVESEKHSKAVKDTQKSK